MSAAQPFTVNEVRDVLNKEGWGHAEIQPVEGGKELMIKLKKSEESVGQMSTHLVGILNKALPDNKFKVIGKSEIGASISQDLRNKAIVAIILSMLGIILYIAWRFEFIFGIGAAIATFHDVLAVLGIFWLLDIEITLLVVTALLTLAGYSLTDTVVVFDRIRENLARRTGQTGRDHQPQRQRGALPHHHHQQHRVPGGRGPVLLRRRGPQGLRPGHDLGVLVGTYSSVFVASPIVYAWRKEAKRVVVKREKVVELAAQKQKREEKKAAKPNPQEKGRQEVRSRGQRLGSEGQATVMDKAQIYLARLHKTGSAGGYCPAIIIECSHDASLDFMKTAKTENRKPKTQHQSRRLWCSTATASTATTRPRSP